MGIMSTPAPTTNQEPAIQAQQEALIAKDIILINEENNNKFHISHHLVSYSGKVHIHPLIEDLKKKGY